MRYELGDCHLHEIWKEIGWTNQDFAERMGLTRQQASDYAHNRKKMGAALLLSAAQAMGVHPARIYDLVPKQSNRRRRQHSTKSTD
ncbi:MULTISPECIES: helix-turn-helix domain-containing protein [Paenibacillus]|uniref:Helix-turn-helix domain-containing protein n=1 Tax=Paenibacillus ehimensis TaxID=79264 RepID=A0ABT8VI52_9BACL|nr:MULTISPECIES: helix-turn-helix domain-containing protein [Paenibacillus]MBU7319038.1 helix-turn-helix domain-containing protein [Paenibacillus oleatilyticus]MCP1306453.1 helix-turn-helix domain-containing protein [Paenibacillus tyrfis]MDO3680666.1 helix-turn-helix domain-containing protein [Paenibacillus ehimensis]